MEELSAEQYRVLLVFHTALRQYLSWSGRQASEAGLTPQQHQLLLAVRGHPGPTPPSIRELAEYLRVRHHSAVELANRAEAAGLVVRTTDHMDQRVVRLRLTDRGSRLVAQLGVRHMEELVRIAEQLGITEETLERLSRNFAQELGEEPA